MEKTLCELNVQNLATKGVGFGLTGDKISKLFSFLDGCYRAGSVTHRPFFLFFYLNVFYYFFNYFIF